MFVGITTIAYVQENDFQHSEMGRYEHGGRRGDGRGNHHQKGAEKKSLYPMWLEGVRLGKVIFLPWVHNMDHSSPARLRVFVFSLFSSIEQNTF